MSAQEGAAASKPAKNMFHASVVEGYGTCILTAAGCATIINGKINHIPHTLLFAALVFGGTLGLLAYLLPSGCHLNSWVTLGLAIAGKFPKKYVPAYLIGQLIGASVGIEIVWQIYGTPSKTIANLGAAYPTDPHFSAQFWIAFLWVGLFVMAVLLAAADSRGPGAAKGLVLFIALSAAIYFSATFTGGGVNVSRELAPEIVGHLKIYWGPLLGGLAGAIFSGLLYKASFLKAANPSDQM